jgi:hypothetical protein
VCIVVYSSTSSIEENTPRRRGSNPAAGTVCIHVYCILLRNYTIWYMVDGGVTLCQIGYYYQNPLFWQTVPTRTTIYDIGGYTDINLLCHQKISSSTTSHSSFALAPLFSQLTTPHASYFRVAVSKPSS